MVVFNKYSDTNYLHLYVLDIGNGIHGNYTVCIFICIDYYKHIHNRIIYEIISTRLKVSNMELR